MFLDQYGIKNCVNGKNGVHGVKAIESVSSWILTKLKSLRIPQ